MLKNFNESDWNIFAGCESEVPRVDYDANFKEAENYPVVGGVILHDGTIVHVYTVDDDGELSTLYALQCRTVEEASVLADAVSQASSANGFVTYKALNDIVELHPCGEEL